MEKIESPLWEKKEMGFVYEKNGYEFFLGFAFLPYRFYNFLFEYLEKEGRMESDWNEMLEQIYAETFFL